MATTGRTLITDALLDLEVLQDSEAATATQARDCLRRLNALASSLNAEPYDWNLPEFDLNTALTLDDGVERALVAKLAIECAPMFHAQISEDLRKRESQATTAVKTPRVAGLTLQVDSALVSCRSGGWDLTTGH